MTETVELPRDPALLRDLINSIQNGSMIRGRLEAPLSIICDGEAVEHTGYYLSTNYSEPVKIRTEHPPAQPETHPNIRDRDRLLLEKDGRNALYIFSKYAGFVEFSDAGNGSEAPFFSDLVPFAARYVGLGYQGTLSFIQGSYLNRENWRTTAAMHFLIGGVAPNREERTTYRVSFECDENPKALEFILPVLTQIQGVQLSLI